MITHFSPQDVIEVAIVDSIDGIVTHNLMISTLVKLFGRLAPQTLLFGFPSGNKVVDSDIFKEMIRNSESYKHPVKFNDTFKLPPRYIESFNEVFDLKKALAALHFNLYTDGTVSTAYFISQMKVRYSQVPQKYMKAFLGTIVREGQSRVSVVHCFEFAKMNCESSLSLALERKYLRFLELKKFVLFLHLFKDMNYRKKISFKRAIQILQETQISESCLKRIFEIYSKDQTAQVQISDFHRFIKDNSEPELACQGLEVLKKVARIIFEKQQSPLSFFLPFEIWPQSKHYLQVERLSLLQLEHILCKNAQIISSGHESEALFQYLARLSSPGTLEVYKSLECQVLIRQLQKVTLEKNFIRDEKQLLDKINEFQTYTSLRGFLESVEITSKGYAELITLQKEMETLYKSLLDRLMANKITRLMDINRSYGISIDQMQLFLMNYTSQGKCSLELEAKRNAIQMQHSKLNTKQYITEKFGIAPSSMRNISKEDFINSVADANKRASGRLKVSQIEINALINVLEYEGKLDLQYFMERIEAYQYQQPVQPEVIDIQKLVKTIENRTEKPITTIFNYLSFTKVKQHVRFIDLRRMFTTFYSKDISSEEVDFLLHYLKQECRSQETILAQELWSFMTKFSKRKFQREKALQEIREDLKTREETAEEIIERANPQFKDEQFQLYMQRIEAIPALKDNTYYQFSFFIQPHYNELDMFKVKKFVEDIDQTKIDLNRRKLTVPQIGLKRPSEVEKPKEEELKKEEVKKEELKKEETKEEQKQKPKKQVKRQDTQEDKNASFVTNFIQNKEKFLEKGTLKEMLKEMDQKRDSFKTKFSKQITKKLTNKEINQNLKVAGFNINQRRNLLKGLAESEGTSVQNLQISMDEVFDKMDQVVKRRRTSLSKEINLIHQLMNSEVQDMIFKVLEQVKLNPERDYYMGNSTILTSEFAALLRCEQIVASLHQTEEFFDTQFGPVHEDDGDQMDEQGRNSLYLGGDPPKSNFLHPDNIEWRFISDIVEEYDDGGKGWCFFDHGPGSNDAKQGMLGDCWFISALSVIATRDALLCGFNQVPHVRPGEEIELTDEIMNQMSGGVYPPVFHIYRKKGLFVFRFFKDFHWLYVLVDTRLPVNRNNNKLVFGSCEQPREFWVPLIEKAYAKLHRSYGQLNSGFINEGLSDMSGLPAHSEKIQVKKQSDVHILFEKLRKLLNEETMMGCSRASKSGQQEVILDNMHTGLYENHAYSLLQAFIIEDSEKNRSYMLLRIRNPWGGNEWKGEWSDNSAEIKKYESELDFHVKKLPPSEQWIPGEDDGTFLMEFTEFCTIFTELYMCIQMKKEQRGFRYECEWNEFNNRGYPDKSEESLVQFMKNHQFSITVPDIEEVIIQLQQPDGRMTSDQGFPFNDKHFTMSFVVFKLPEGKRRLTVYSKDNQLRGTKFRAQKLATLRMRLTKGSYIIVPFTNQKGQDGKFYLTIYPEHPDTFKTEHVNGGGGSPCQARVIATEEEQYPDSIDTSKQGISEARKALIKERLQNLVELGDKEGIERHMKRDDIDDEFGEEEVEVKAMDDEDEDELEL